MEPTNNELLSNVDRANNLYKNGKAASVKKTLDRANPFRAAFPLN